MSLYGLSFAKTCGLIGYSTFVWGAGVVAIRYLGPHLFRTNLNRSLTMAITVPLMYSLVWFPEKIFGLTERNRLAAVALMNGFAISLDGIAHTWFPTAYENPSLQKTNPLAACTISRYGSGWILYFAGFCLTMFVFL